MVEYIISFGFYSDNVKTCREITAYTRYLINVHTITLHILQYWREVMPLFR